MRRGKSGHTCPKCGQAGQIVHADGSEADFEPLRGWSAWPGIRAGLAGLVIVAGLAGVWLWYAGPGAVWLQAGQAAASAGPASPDGRPASPDWRPDGRANFASPFAGGVMGVFGSAGADRPLAFAALGNGAFVTVAETAGIGSEPAYWIVKLDGGDRLTVFPLVVEGRLSGASIAPAGLDGFVLALTGEGGVRLAAYGAGQAPRWQRDLAMSDPAGQSAIALDADGIAYLVAPAGAGGRAGVSAYDGAGDLLWQRSFDMAPAGRIAAALLPEGGLLAGFETFLGEGEADIRLVWFSPGGDILHSAGGLRLGGRLAGMSAAGGPARVLAVSGAPALVTFGPGGEVARQLLPEAALHDVLLLGETAAGAAVIAASYTLAGIQTDLVVMEETPGGWVRERAALGPQVQVTHMVVAGEAMILAGRAGAGAGAGAGTGAGAGDSADIFILAAPVRPAGGGAQVPAASLAGRLPEIEPAPAPVPVPAPAPAPEPEPEPEPGPALPAGRGETASAAGAGAGPEAGGQGLLTCRFICQDGDLVFPLMRTVGPQEAEAAGGAAGLHAAACRRIGAEAAPTPADCDG